MSKALNRWLACMSLTFGMSLSAADVRTDVIVAGAGTSGVAAAIEAARMGASVVVVEPTQWVGGMLTSAGVSCVDGNYNLRGGLWKEFVDSLIGHYGSTEALRTGWVSSICFEPSVGQVIMRRMIDAEPDIQLFTSGSISDVKRGDDGLWRLVFTNSNGVSNTVTAPVLIDCTELGDVAAALGVAYDIGMESGALTGEDVAPAEANDIIQDLTYCAVLKDYGRDVTIECPPGYNADDYACAAISDYCITPKEPNRMWAPDKMITYGRLPGGKYMLNWPIEGNDFYVNMIELDSAGRHVAVERAKELTLGFLYFIQTRLGFNTLGIADDEFPSADGLPLIPYHRESRRIHGLVRYNLTDMCKPYDPERPLYRTAVAVGDYPVDHHHKRYTGADSLPDLHFHPVPSFGVPMGVMLPRDCDGLIVAEKSISVSNLVNGSTRLQPVVFQLGQAAGVIAAMAALNGCQPADIAVRDVQNRLLADGGYLLPYLDCKPGDELFAPLQRIGACGLLHSESRRVGWTNETHIYPERALLHSDLALLAEYLEKNFDSNEKKSDPVTWHQLGRFLELLGFDIDGLRADEQVVTRGEYAMLIDRVVDPFNRVAIDINGKILTNREPLL